MRCPGRDWADSDNSEALPGVLGNKGMKITGTGEHRPFWETGNIENQDFILGLGEQGHFFEGNKGTGTPRFHWEGLNSLISIRILNIEPRPKRAE